MHDAWVDVPVRQPPDRFGTYTRSIGTHEHFRWLRKIVWAILILNVFDAFLTLFWVYTGRATEANPAMEVLVHEYPVLFVVVKFSLVLLGSLLLWRFRRRRLSVVAIFLAFMVYYAVLLYHLQSMNLQLLSFLS